MAETGILTGQYVRIAHPTASVGDRMVAQLIDWTLQLAYLLLIFLNASDLEFLPIKARIALVLLVPLYPLLCEVLNHGQTLGKWARGMRVVMRDGSTPTLSAYLIRWLLVAVDGPAMAYLGLLVIALTRNHQRLGDLAAGTVVVKLNTWKNLKVSLDDFQHLSAGYQPHYAAAADLSLEQVAVISRTLDSMRSDSIGLLAQKVQQMLDIRKKETHDYEFLRHIVQDYQYYALEAV